jgi:hypothetical protein
MKLHFAAAAAFAAVLPAAPALAHCKTVHHRVAARTVVHHRVAYAAPVRHRAVRTACACNRIVRRAPVYRERVYREAYYEPAYRSVVYRPRIVTIAYARPLYRPYRPHYSGRYHRDRPVFYGARYERFPRHLHYGGEGFRRDRFARYEGYRRHDRSAFR